MSCAVFFEMSGFGCPDRGDCAAVANEMVTSANIVRLQTRLISDYDDTSLALAHM